MNDDIWENPLNTVLRRFNRDVRLYLIASALFGFSLFGGVYSLLLNLYLLRLGYGPRFVGLVNATGALSFAASSMPSGVLGGRWGSRRCMIAGICVSVIGFGVLSQAELVPPALQGNYILVTYSLALFGLALYFVNGTPYLMGIADPKERNDVFSVHAALLPFAGFAGSLFGGFLPGRLAAVSNLPPRITLPLTAIHCSLRPCCSSPPSSHCWPRRKRVPHTDGRPCLKVRLCR